MVVDGVKINDKNTINYIKHLTKDIHCTNEKDVITMIMALQHLNNKQSWVQGINLTVGLGSMIATSFWVPASAVILFSAGITAGVVTCYNAINSFIKSNDYSAVSDKLIDELMHRYDNPFEAYLQIANTVLTIEREDLVDFFKRANEFNN